MMTAREFARRLGYTYSGDSEATVTGLCYGNRPVEGSVAVAVYDRDIYESSACTILTDKPAVAFGKNIIYSLENINTAVIKAAKLLIEEGLLKDYSKSGELHSRGAYMCGENVCIGKATFTGAFTVIENGAVIGENCRIGSSVYIGADTVIGSNTVIGSGTRVSAESVFHAYENGYIHFAGAGKTVIGSNVFIGANTVIQRGTLGDTVISSGCVIGDLTDIGHDCVIGENTRIVSQCGIAGNAVIGKNVVIYGQSGVANFVEIGDNAVVISKTRVTKNVGSGQTVSGDFGRPHSDELRLRAKLNKLINGRN